MITAAQHDVLLLAAAFAAILSILLLILFARWHAALSLLAASVLLGLLTRMPLVAIAAAMGAGAWGILKRVAVLVIAGSMIGSLMAESGAALSICELMLRIFGRRYIVWAMMLFGLIVGLSVFFEVGFVLLVPIAIVLAERTRLRPIYVGLPLLAGLSIAHALVPPHPAVLLAVVEYHAEIGRTMVWGLLLGLPSAALAGPLYAEFLYRGRRDATGHAHMAGLHETSAEAHPATLPPVGLSFGLLLLPVALIAASTFGGRFLVDGAAKRLLMFAGNANVALLLTLTLSLLTLARASAAKWTEFGRVMRASLRTALVILLLLAAAGAFGRVLQASGASAATVRIALHAHIPLLVLAWLIAMMVRMATGSATVAMASTAGILAASAATFPHPELLALATGAGSIFFSYVNDPGFWLVKEYFTLDMQETIVSWSLCEAILSVSALGFVLIAAAWLG
ncbi:MAG TPA: gluconate:H+ symporter [Acidobacteriaceae bacterium]|nr:gluconate:H+ symporter [Acidobacteriaceae bacterium]